MISKWQHINSYLTEKYSVPIHVPNLMFFVILIISQCAYAQQNFGSRYTNLSGRTCKKSIDDKTTGAFTLKCPGIAGYDLNVVEDDERSSIEVITPNKKIFALDYWDVVARGFSSLGNRAEWRIETKNGTAIPIALIVRVNSAEQNDLGQPKRLSVLAVAKIRHDMACVIGSVDARLADANIQARKLADKKDLDCLQSNTHH